jgi:4-amino-4-deoxy-L-arabinose transferase-like glycosyltransferase
LRRKTGLLSAASVNVFQVKMAATARRGHAIAIALALLASYALLAKHLRSHDHDFDAVHMYMPLGVRLLQEGLSFFADAASVQMPPFSYAYPAIFGAEIERVRLANYLLSGVTILLFARAAYLLHSMRAAVAVAWIFALCPLMKPFLVAPNTEAPYFLLCGGWIVALAEWRRTRHTGYALAAGLCLGLAILTRGTIFYLAVVLALYFAFKRQWAAAAGHAIAIALPLAFIVKNAVLFSFPFFSTGANNALYLGTAPVMGGYDPHYVGMIYDVGAVIRGGQHLTIEADRLLGGVARMLIAQMPVHELTFQYARKLVAFLFITNADGHALAWRFWRIGLMVAAIVGSFGIADRALRYIVIGVPVYQTLVHIPLLYLHRYSVGALDPWLVLLGAIGLAMLLEGRRTRRVLLFVAVLVPLLAAGALARLLGPPEPDVFRGPQRLIWEARNVAVWGESEIPVSGARRLHSNLNTVVVLEASGDCRFVRVSYRRAGDPRFSRAALMRIERAGHVRPHQVGGSEKLHLDAEGTLRIESACPVAVERIAIYSSVAGANYHDRLLGLPQVDHD